jgi:DNA-binding CsgD family transcriptional regulator
VLGRVLVGRERELARLEPALAGCGGSGASIFAIIGEPGIGKTRLLAELGGRAERRGLAVFSGAATELEHEIPFGPFVDALDPYLASVSRSRLRALTGEQRAELAAIFPALEAPQRRGVDALQQERYRAHRAVGSLLELIAQGGRGLMLVVDDVHWADAASLELLAHLMRRPPRARIALAFAYRPGEAPELLRAAVSRGERDQACECLALSPLRRSDADQLLDPALTAAVRERIYAASGGVPFYLIELARAWRGELEIDPSGAVDEVPAAVLSSIADQLAGLGKRARIALQAAAVAGDPFTHDLAAAAAGLSERATLAALDRLLAVDLVRAGSAPVEFRFRHPIVRRAVYDSTSPAWRLAAHARLARVLVERGAPDVLVAPHLERSARGGDEGAIVRLSNAAAAVAARAPATAARWLQAALRLVGEGGAPERRFALLAPLAAALGSSGQLDESREALGELLELLPSSASEPRARIVGFMALVDHLRGRHGAARGVLERSLAEVGPNSGEAALLHLELAAERFFSGDWVAMRLRAERGLRLAEGLDDPGLRAVAAAQLGLAEYSLGSVARAVELTLAARALLADCELGGQPRLEVFDWLGWCELSLERYDAAREHFERGLEIGRRTGQGHLLATMSFGLVFVHGMVGSLDRAAELSDGTLELAWLSHSGQLISWALGMRAWIALRRGELAQAVALGEEGRRLADQVVANPFSAVCAGWLGEVLIEAGEPRRGRRELLDALGGPVLPRIERPFRPYFYEVLARAELALGQPDMAGEWAARASSARGEVPLAGRIAFVRRTEAELSLTEGDPELAATLSADAVELFTEAGHRFDSARARIVHGRALAAAGHRADAISELKQARVELEQCGAIHQRDQAVRELRRLGERIGRGGRRSEQAAGLASLSGRELEVARLVTERLTNREIAERLVLSEKTIERHLSSVFRKLDASSRVEVARAVERERTRVPR